ncbi:Gfo/Idh/MocA family oxidoreductase [uncultured Croceitalea sp.]|uniref:Gfo/Idh/MocA family protein n=1 Tax=uncultured Croceitalea sp. TaxID=1798908 RepID=UPI00330605E7
MNTLKKSLFLFFLSLLITSCSQQKKETSKTEVTVGTEKEKSFKGTPLKIAVIGLTHAHVHWVLGNNDAVEIIGIVEPNKDLARRLTKQYGYSMDIVYDSMEALYKNVKPEAVTAFNSIYEHLKVVEFFAPKGVHIMVEKPLAVSWEHAQKMEKIANQHKVHLLTNYETSWYGSNHKAYELSIANQKIGALQRMVFHHGHPGPIEIGCNQEFLDWLTDPKLNGGGAVVDFGCYGANLTTWFLQGQTPEKVTCITRQYKPEKYPKVDDDATIILDYKDLQVIIQASWNWSHSRKDLELYGRTGYVICTDDKKLTVLENEKKGPFNLESTKLPHQINNPFTYLHGVVKENIPINTFDLASLENNLIVVQILEAAKQSAKTGKTIDWNHFFKTTTP